MITSLTNEKVKNWVRLGNKKYRDENNTFLVEGLHLVKEAIDFGIVEEVITIEESIEGTLVSEAVMKKITNQSSIVKCCAVCHKPQNNVLSERTLILDNVQDPGNVGTILRTALSFGFDTIFLSNCADIYSSKVLRATQGAIFKMNLIEMDAVLAINELKEKGYTIYGTSLRNAKPLQKIETKKPLAIVLGNEGLGVKEEILKITDDNIFIEINNMESLNVAIAGAIIMYKFKEE